MITSSLNFTSLDPQTFQALLKDKEGILLDIRTSQEYDDFHLKDAINIDLYRSDFEEKINNLDKSFPYFIYCHTGSRTKMVLDIMKKGGFREVYDLKGGLLAWEVVGL